MELFSQIWNGVIIQPMINSLLILYSIAISNFGLAIILFTIIIRAAMMPLTVKQSRQMKAMTALQPKIKAIQNKFKNDKQKQSQETMKLYKEQGVNPIGCLGPMFIQFPIWIGLYQAILQTVPNTPESLVKLSGHLYGWLPLVHDVVPINSHFFWMDLANPDPSPVVMPILVGISMFLMQKMTSMPAMDERQASTNKMMLWMMPIMFGFFTISFPSGLALYWVVSNIVGIVIQGFITGWDPMKNLLNFASNRTSQPTAAIAGGVSPDLEEEQTNEVDRNDSEDSGRGDRNRPKRTRRRPRRGRNRRH
ncbi:MAG: YidC/Oxa1 family membrane protein insertase [SAR202 cluster bacterium]|nr:YidC/Oxa1 family membrane protein insertase [SAR202 cluster bacterium]